MRRKWKECAKPLTSQAAPAQPGCAFRALGPSPSAPSCCSCRQAHGTGLCSLSCSERAMGGPRAAVALAAGLLLACLSSSSGQGEARVLPGSRNLERATHPRLAC